MIVQGTAGVWIPKQKAGLAQSISQGMEKFMAIAVSNQRAEPGSKEGQD